MLAAFAKIGRDGHEWQRTSLTRPHSEECSLRRMAAARSPGPTLRNAAWGGWGLGQELMRSGALSDQGQGMVVEGIVAPMEAIENILTASKRKSRQEANKALSDAARLQQKPNINKTLQTTNTHIETNTNIMCCIYVAICVYVLCNCVCVVIQ
jgi:hypothetical protein